MTEEQNTEALKKARTFSDNKDKIDGFYNGYVQATIELQKQIEIDAEQIRALQKQNGELTDKVNDLEDKLANADYQLEGRDNEIRELEAQIEKMKLQYDYAFNQLCKSREILCSMLSQYRDRKEIDYSTRECGEKLLKEGVYKND